MIKKLTAADAIKDVLSRARVADPTPKALEQLREICKHNDDQIATSKRISFETAIQILSGFGWTGRTFKALNAVCIKHLSRKGYARP